MMLLKKCHIYYALEYNLYFHKRICGIGERLGQQQYADFKQSKLE